MFCCTIAVFFLEFWKRKEVTLAYHWDVLEYEEEEVTIIFNFIQVPYVNIQ